MNFNDPNFQWYLAWGAFIALIVHGLLKRYWLACLVSAVCISTINLIGLVWTGDQTVRPSDVAFWLPMIFMFSLPISFVPSLVIGLPFWWFRKRRSVPPPLN